MPVQSFSAIVGPNGSGKSNVIDAMLFVFGKRAKHVRSTPLDVLQSLHLHQGCWACSTAVRMSAQSTCMYKSLVRHRSAHEVAFMGACFHGLPLLCACAL